MAEKYGELDRKTWPDDIRKGLAECFRLFEARWCSDIQVE
jgi:hypothetical protein